MIAPMFPWKRSNAYRRNGCDQMARKTKLERELEKIAKKVVRKFWIENSKSHFRVIIPGTKRNAVVTVSASPSDNARTLKHFRTDIVRQAKLVGAELI